jgi:hypothetical protein
MLWMIGLTVRFGMPGVHYLLSIWKHLDSMDNGGERHFGVELILIVREESLILCIISLIAMRITLGLCCNGHDDRK